MANLYNVTLAVRNREVEFFVIAQDYDDARIKAENQWVEWGYTRAPATKIELIAEEKQHPTTDYLVIGDG